MYKTKHTQKKKERNIITTIMNGKNNIIRLTYDVRKMTI